MGYTGGQKSNPTYNSLGDHTETVDLEYDPEVTTYEELLEIFWSNHNPLQNHSRQYMCAVFYHNKEQKELAEKTLKYMQQGHSKPIVTQILEASTFYEAEIYHQKYLLQKHPALCESLGFEGTKLIQSHVATRLNGYVGGYGNTADFEKEWPQWGITVDIAKYIRPFLRLTIACDC